MTAAFDALKRLQDGNRRFASNVRESDVLLSHRRAELTGGRLGLERVVLETGIRQQAAIALYRGMGYSQIPAWGDYVGSPVAVCMGKTLNERSTPA